MIKSYDVKDIDLADAGRKRIDWAETEMPVLRLIRERFERERPLEGLRLSACLHVTSETANLARTLAAGGADVVVCASNPLSTQDDVAASLVKDEGIATFAVKGEDKETYFRHMDSVLDERPQLTMDDGCDLVSRLHSQRVDQVADVVVGTEETTTGVIRLRAMEADGALKYPIVAVNDADTKHMFDNRYGTGQSTLDGIIRATNVLLAGQTVVVLGYGWTGRGVALRAQGLGASVIVCEVDPLRALEARMEGFEVLPARRAAERGDVFVTVTGARDVLRREHFARMKDGAVLANAGHFDVEIALGDLGDRKTQVLPLVEQYEQPDGRRLNLLARGQVVNLAAAQGHPAAVMDVSFALQALSAELLVRERLEPGVQAVPPRIDAEVARLKLEALGVEIDALTPEQEAYLNRWRG